MVLMGKLSTLVRTYTLVGVRVIACNEVTALGYIFSQAAWMGQLIAE